MRAASSFAFVFDQSCFVGNAFLAGRKIGVVNFFDDTFDRLEADHCVVFSGTKLSEQTFMAGLHNCADLFVSVFLVEALNEIGVGRNSGVENLSALK